MSRRKDRVLRCVVDFTSIVHCDDDWTPNHVEHIGKGKHVRRLVNITDHPELSGYLRLQTRDDDYMLIVAGDWEMV